MTIRLMLLLPFLVGASCETPPQEDSPAPPIAHIQTDTRAAGAIRGRLTWSGEPPSVAPLDVRVNPLAPATFSRRQRQSNPNAPTIDSCTGGLDGAVVELRGAHTSAVPRWPHAPVRVELRDDQFHIRQGNRCGNIGLVRRGDMVEFVSAQTGFHSVRVRGATFFTITFTEKEQTVARRLDQVGVVELTSGAGRYWMRGYLFVVDHPYCALTDSQGAFTLDGVIPGDYQLVGWLPNWGVARRERDPETGVVSRLTFQPPHEKARPIRIVPGQTETIILEMSALPGNLYAR